MTKNMKDILSNLRKSAPRTGILLIYLSFAFFIFILIATYLLSYRYFFYSEMLYHEIIFPLLSQLLLVSMLATIISIALYIFVNYFKMPENEIAKSQTNEKDFETKFTQAFLQGLKVNAIKNVKDITNIYEACIPQGYPSDQSEIARILKKIIVVLYSSFDSENANGNQVLNWTKGISEYIEKLEEISPYANLPNAERGILNDIINYSDSNNKLAIKQKISELSNIILIKENELNRAKRENDRSTMVAIVGITLTIAFGLISIFPLLRQTTGIISYFLNSTIK